MAQIRVPVYQNATAAGDCLVDEIKTSGEECSDVGTRFIRYFDSFTCKVLAEGIGDVEGNVEDVCDAFFVEPVHIRRCVLRANVQAWNHRTYRCIGLVIYHEELGLE